VTGAIAARRPRIALGALGATTIVAYGACYYSYGVLIVPIAADTGWSRAGLGTVFSAVLLLTGIGGLLAGRVLDRHGARRLFLLAGQLGAACILLASLQTNLAAFAFAYAAGCGLVGALGFYHVTQPTAARLSPAEPARAIIRLTIAGAFAAPVYLPLTGYLVESIGWRDTLRIDAATVAAAFLFAALVVGRPDANPPAAAPARARTVLSDAWRSRAVRTWLLVTLIIAAATDTMLLYQVPAMIAAGLTITVASTIAGALGIAQLAGRLPLAVPLARLGTRRTLVLGNLTAALAAATLLASGNLPVAITYSLLAGTSLGAISALQGIYTHELIDPRHLGLLFGAQQAVYGIGGAIGPAVGALALATTNSYAAVIAITAAAFLTSGALLRFST